MFRLGIISTIILLFVSNLLFAQGNCYLQGQTPPLAIPVCGTSAFIQNNVSICNGDTILVLCHDGILYQDKNPFWYKFHCFKAGVIGFLIVPNIVTEDYDWMLFDVTGHNPNDVYKDTTCIVAYNWSGVPGNTGTAPNTLDSNSCASGTDTSNGQFVTPNQTKMPALIQGHDYLLMVSHFTNTQFGYQITFTGGNAVITDTISPRLKYARAICDGTNMMIVTNKKMRCTSLASDGSDFILSPSTANIISASSNCNGGFDFDTVHLTLSNPLPPGKYNIVIKQGTDGNTLTDICYNDIPIGASIPVEVFPMYATPMDSIVVADSCNPGTVQLVFRRPLKCNSIAPDGSDFIISGPSPVQITSSSTACNSDSLTFRINVNFSAPIQTGGNYTITLVKGTDGNTVIDECGFESYTNQSLTFHAAAPYIAAITGNPTLCVNHTDTLSNITLNGIWKSNNMGVASINNIGIITGISADTTTIYYTAKGTNGCTGYQSYFITVNPSPTVNPIQGNKNLCNGLNDTLQSSTSGGIWTNNNPSVLSIDPVTGIVVPTGSGTDTANYTVTNLLGCSSTVNFIITIRPKPVISPIIGNSSICINNFTTYQDATRKGFWHTDDSTIAFIDYAGNIYPHSAGTTLIKYTVINKYGCIDSVAKNITVNPLPVITLIQVSTDLCLNKNTLATNATPGGQWLITNNNLASIDASGNIIALSPGRDTVRYIVTSSIGCTDSVSTYFTIRPLPYVDAIRPVNPTVCTNDSSRLKINNSGGVWSSNPSSIAAINNNGTVFGIISGYTNITYTITNSYGCIDSTTTILIVNDSPAPDFNIPTDICLPNAIATFINTTTPNSTTNKYVWNIADSVNPAIANTKDFTHQFSAPIQASGYKISLSATNSNNCTATLTKLMPAIAIHPQPASVIGTIPAPATICLGNPIQIFDNSTASSVLRSIWYFGNGQIDTSLTENYTYTNAGTFWLGHKIIDSYGCISTLSQTLVTIDSFPVVNAGSEQYVIAGSSVILSPTFIADNPTLLWTPDIYLNNNKIANPICTPLTDTTYTLSVTSSGGCISKDTVRIIVLDKFPIPNSFSPNGDSNHDTWDIPALSKYPNASVLVFNRYGQKVFESKGYTHPWDGTYAGKKVPVGVYFYLINRGENLPPLSGSLTIFW